jgi:hypothetical protein
MSKDSDTVAVLISIFSTTAALSRAHIAGRLNPDLDPEARAKPPPPPISPANVGG